MKFSKVLAKYYHKWLRDSYDSIDYCIEKGRPDLAEKYKESAKYYFDIIINNWDAIEFFSVGDRAFLYDEIHPIEFRGYE